MNPDDFPAPKDGFVLTHFLVVSDKPTAFGRAAEERR